MSPGLYKGWFRNRKDKGRRLWRVVNSLERDQEKLNGA